MTLLTALRTAATSAMAARALARPESTVMALIGTGSQAEFQTLAFQEILNITHIRAWDTDPEALTKFEHNAAAFGLHVHRANSTEDAITGADIITTCTADKQHAVILTDAMVSNGVHVNAIGGDCPGKTELAASILHRSNVFVEYTPQTRMEGEIQNLARDHPVTELWTVLTGEHRGRVNTDDITVFDSVGFAIEDFSALRFLDNQITGTPFFTNVDLIAAPHNPKNLYSLIND
jgi:ornithine cyclodeaminase